MDDKTVSFRYQYSDNYELQYVNGAFGGISPQGEIAINFFLEKLPIPNGEAYTLGEKGAVGERIRVDMAEPSYQVIRRIQAGVIMNLDCAKRVRTWLSNQIDEFERLKGQSGG